MPLNLPIYVIVGERPLFAIKTADGGMDFQTWDFAENKFVIGGPDDWDVLLGFESPGGGQDTKPGATGKDGGADHRHVTKKQFDAHVASLRRKTVPWRP